MNPLLFGLQPFLRRWYLSFSRNNDQDEKTIKIPRIYEWQTPKYSWIHEKIWIPEQLQFIIRKTTKIEYDRKEVSRKLNKILLHELTIDASLETEIELVDENVPHDLIGGVSFEIIFLLCPVTRTLIIFQPWDHKSHYLCDFLPSYRTIPYP